MDASTENEVAPSLARCSTPIPTTPAAMPRINNQTDKRICPSASWAHIDAVLVINLDTRTDRWDAFQNKLGPIFPSEKLHRLAAVRGTELPGYGDPPWFAESTGARASSWAGVAGCVLSHRRAMEAVLQNGWKRVLICEDDIEMSSADILPDISAMLRCTPDNAYLYLGYHSAAPRGRLLERTTHGELWRVEGVLACHSYIVSDEVCRRLLPHLPDERNVWAWVARYRAIDNFCRDWMQSLAGVASCVAWPVLFRQQDFGSDIDTSHRSVPADRLSGHPLPLRGPGGFLHRLTSPFHRLKLRLNAWRTHRRARRHGLPGYRRRKKDEK